jgi:hypothetical protein
LDARLTILLCKQNVAKLKEVETGCTLAESSEEGYGSKRAVLPMMMIYVNRTLKNKLLSLRNVPFTGSKTIKWRVYEAYI